MIHRDKYWSQATDAAAFLNGRGVRDVDLVIQCGSGLSGLTDLLGGREVKVAMEEIPHLPAAAVTGHGKDAWFAHVGDKGVLVFNGRIHLYEGYDPLTAGFPAAIAKACGARLFVATNAAGGLNQHFGVGDAMVHRDFINFQHDNAAAHLQTASPAERFVDPKPAYDPAASDALAKALAGSGFDTHSGVYVSVRGPLFETRAELAMLRGFGADAIGMSTVPEITVCHLLGLPAAGVSLITNACFDSSHTGHDDVLDQSQRAVPALAAALREFISQHTLP